MPVKDLCRKHGFSDASFYNWRSRYGGMEVSDVRKLRELEAENAKLKKLLAEAMLDIEALKVVTRGKRSARRRAETPWTPCARQDRRLAHRLQPEPTAQLAGGLDAGGVRGRLAIPASRDCAPA